jgi:hypothetical protein
MSGVHDAAVKDLGRQIAQETDPEKVHQLLVSVHTALKEGQEEARLRMSDSQGIIFATPQSQSRIRPEQNPRVFEDLRGLLERERGISFGKNSSRSEA